MRDSDQSLGAHAPRAGVNLNPGGKAEINTRNTARGTSAETVRHHPCTPATELGRLGAFNAGGRLELLRVVTQLLRVVTATGGHETLAPGSRI